MLTPKTWSDGDEVAVPRRQRDFSALRRVSVASELDSRRISDVIVVLLIVAVGIWIRLAA